MGKEERKIELYLDKRVRERGGFTRKFISPAHRGVPDRICFLPQGVVLFVEVKAPGGKLGKLQEREIRRMRKLGAVAAAVTGSKGVDQLMEDINAHYTNVERINADKRRQEQEAPLIITP